MKNVEIDESKINFDVYNGLNLYSPYLGEAYAKFKWNPLGDDFRLDISFIERYLENAKSDNEVTMPPFLENDPRQVMEAFNLATKRNKELLTDLQTRYNNDEFKNFKDTNIEKQVEEILFILKCRQKMFEITVGQLKAKGIDAFTAYKNIRGLNKKLSQLLEEAYTEEWNKKVALQNMLSWAQTRSIDFGDLYKPNPFVFDKVAHQRRNREHNFIEGLINTVQEVANAFMGRTSDMRLEEMPQYQDFVETFQNLPPRPQNTNTQNTYSGSHTYSNNSGGGSTFNQQ